MNAPRDSRGTESDEPAVRDADELSDDQLEYVLGGLARPWTEGMFAPAARGPVDDRSDAPSALVA